MQASPPAAAAAAIAAALPHSTPSPQAHMVLYLIGLGLYDEQDITLRGFAAVKGCARVYLEAYTSILLCDKVCWCPAAAQLFKQSSSLLQQGTCMHVVVHTVNTPTRPLCVSSRPGLRCCMERRWLLLTGRWWRARLMSY